MERKTKQIQKKKQMGMSNFSRVRKGGFEAGSGY